MLGDGLTHGRPVSSNQSSRRQLRICTTVRSAPIWFSPLNSFASSPMRHAVTDRHREVTDEAELRLVERRAFDLEAVDRVGAVEHDDRQLPLRRLLHHVRHRGHVGVEARADVLEVDHDRVEPLEHRRGRTPAVAVERVDRQTRPARRLAAGTLASSMPRMPCSGLNSATSSTSFASCRRSIAVAPSLRPAGVVRDQADALAVERRESLRAQHVEAGHDRRSRGAGGGSVPDGAEIAPGPHGRRGVGRLAPVSAEAATVATRARSGVTSPLPSGWTRFDRNTTNIPVSGSIQSDVPVKPVWPNEPTGSSSPRLDE